MQFENKKVAVLFYSFVVLIIGAFTAMIFLVVNRKDKEYLLESAVVIGQSSDTDGIKGMVSTTHWRTVKLLKDNSRHTIRVTAYEASQYTIGDTIEVKIEK